MPPVYDAPEFPEKRLNQGDVFERVRFVGRVADRDEVDVAELKGLVVAHSCDCDKFEEATEKGDLTDEELARWPVAVAPLESAEILSTSNLGHARSGRMPRYFFLPEEDGLEAMLADMWRVQPIPWTELAACERLATLSVTWQKRLWIHIWELHTRVPAAEVFREDVAQ